MSAPFTDQFSSYLLLLHFSKFYQVKTFHFIKNTNSKQKVQIPSDNVVQLHHFKNFTLFIDILFLVATRQCIYICVCLFRFFLLIFLLYLWWIFCTYSTKYRRGFISCKNKGKRKRNENNCILSINKPNLFIFHLYIVCVFLLRSFTLFFCLVSCLLSFFFRT